MAPKPKFQEGEKLLCYHGPLLYEAKCMKLDIRDGKGHYLIHYNGWNKNWDEWVQESRIMKMNEAGFQKQRELLKNHGALTKKNKTAKKLEKELKKQQKINEKAAKEKKAEDAKKEKTSAAKEKQAAKEKDKKEKESKQRPFTPQPTAADRKREREQEKNQKDKDNEQGDKDKKEVSSVQSSQSSSSTQDSLNSSLSGEPKRKRARTDQSVESEESYLSKIEVKIKIPEDLKPLLVDDWDLITRQKMLVTLPCKMTVDDIIDDYVKSKCAKNANANKDAILETMLGCKDYFNVMLGPQLLYKFERPQYSDVLSENPDKPMSSLYGAIHFLRLFVRLGAMLAYTALDERTVHILLQHIHDFLKYLSKNGPSLFKMSNYEIAPPDYHRKAI